MGYGSDGFTPQGSCTLSSTAQAYVSAQVTNGSIFSLAANTFSSGTTAGYICEKESKHFLNFLTV
jgi:hypothetical protein